MAAVDAKLAFQEETKHHSLRKICPSAAPHCLSKYNFFNFPIIGLCWYFSSRIQLFLRDLSWTSFWGLANFD